MNRAIFVTGTNTEVGKTIVTRAIARALVNRGMRVRAIKPVESGAPEVSGALAPLDASALKRASRYGGDLRDLFVYAFPHPVSPHRAAERVGASIDSKRVLRFMHDHIRAAEITLIEGAGGLLVPLSSTVLYADVIAEAKAGLVIVSPNQLGTINATLLTIEAARSRCIPVLGVILNRADQLDLGNEDAIAKFGDVPILGIFPDAEDLDDNGLAEAAEQHIDLNPLLHFKSSSHVD